MEKLWQYVRLRVFLAANTFTYSIPMNKTPGVKYLFFNIFSMFSIHKVKITVFATVYYTTCMQQTRRYLHNT